MLIAEHKQMVKDLAKPGEVILETMTPRDAHLQHMIIGIAGEVRELLGALSKNDWENAVEELGDLEFYFEGYRQAFPNYIPAVNVEVDRRLGWKELYEATDDLLDLTKRITIYRKPIPENNVHLLFNKIQHMMNNCYDATSITREEALEHNLNKLLKGDRARYKEGKYSDEQANARADKQE